MLPEPGKQIWQEKTGSVWPHRGWWSKVETLDISIFDTPKNEWVYKKYVDAKNDPSGYLILATGRLDTVTGMRDAVSKILEYYNFQFDELYLNWGGDTFKFKTTLFEKMISKTGCRHFVMYDDRLEHLPHFEEWAKTQMCVVTIVDVVNKTAKTFNS
jgi:hypothetical protein